MPVWPARCLRIALPSRKFFEALAEQWRDKLENPALLSRFHHRVGVGTRHMVMPLASYQDLTRWGDANRLWLEHAEQLGEQAIDLALQRAGLDAIASAALLTVSVTGISSPSLDAHLDESHGSASEHSPHANLRAGMRGGRGGHRAGRRLCPRISRSRRGAAFGGAVLAHLAAQRSVDRKPDLVRTVRGWRSRRDRSWG